MNKLALILMTIAMIFLYSCEEKNSESTGKVEFSFESKPILKSTEESPTMIILTILNSNNEIVYNRLKIELIEFNGQYITKPLAIESGKYFLTEFFVGCCENKILYAAPTENSELSKFVDNPLPIEFNISADNVTKVIPEIISTKNNDPANFGYSTFSFEIVHIVSFQMAVFTFDKDISNYRLVDATLQEYDENGNVFISESLQAKTNTIKLPIRDSYFIKIAKNGYKSSEIKLSYDSLLTYSNTPMIITLDKIDTTDYLLYLPFNGNALDESSNHFDGLVNGAVLTEDRSGNPESAYHFNGNSYIDLGNILNDYLAGEGKQFTITCWVKCDSISSNDFIFGKNSDSNCDANDRQFNMKMTTANHLSFLFHSNRFRGDSYREYDVTDENNIIDEWFHIAVTYDALKLYNEPSNAVKIYVNGAEKTINHTYNPLQSYGPFEKTNAHLSVGAPVNSDGQICGENLGFVGSIDEVKLFNRCLTGSEIECMQD